MQINVHFTFLSQYDPNQPIFLLAKLRCRCLSLEYFQLAGARSMSFYIQGHFISWNKSHKQLLAVVFYSYQASIEKFKKNLILLLISMVCMLLHQFKKLNLNHTLKDTYASTKNDFLNNFWEEKLCSRKLHRNFIFCVKYVPRFKERRL